MVHQNPDESAASESIEMYLLRIALLQENDEPVPVPLLAQELSISPVSANEMCRKLMQRGLVDYQPYKGVTLTPQGEAVAQTVLRRRRLWEVFLVEKLSIEPHQAEDMACRFEHITPDELTERLAAFLEHPALSPQNEPIPGESGASARIPSRPLTALAVGQRGRVIGVVAGEMVRDFLQAQGVSSGVIVKVLALAADGSLLVEIAEQHLALSRAIAAYVDIEPLPAAEPFDTL